MFKKNEKKTKIRRNTHESWFFFAFKAQLKSESIKKKREKKKQKKIKI
jgi:hypothetical protein